MKKYNSLSEWRKENPREYTSASNNGWLEEIYKHTGWAISPTTNFGPRKPDGYWTKEKCIKIAKKYKTKKEWKEGYSASYAHAMRSGWYGECTTHIKKTKRLLEY